MNDKKAKNLRRFARETQKIYEQNGSPLPDVAYAGGCLMQAKFERSGYQWKGKQLRTLTEKLDPRIYRAPRVVILSVRSIYLRLKKYAAAA